MEGGDVSEELTPPAMVHRSPMSYEVVEPDKPINRQLFENSALANSAIQTAAETDPLRLHGSEDSPPNFAIIHEKPEHRLIVYLKSRGLSNNEVAEKTGYTPSWVSQICRQPWFRIRLVQELRAAGMDKVAKLLEASAVDSVFTLLEIRDDREAPKAVRRQAADSLLDRWLGRPTVHITKDGERVPSTPEISQVDAELREIEEQLKEKSNGSTEVQH